MKDIVRAMEHKPAVPEISEFKPERLFVSESQRLTEELRLLNPEFLIFL